MAIPGGLAGLNFGFNALSSIQGGFQNFISLIDSLRRRRLASDIIGGEIAQAQQLYPQLSRDLLAGYGAALNQYQSDLGSLIPMLDQSGEQQRADINRQFDNYQASSLADLTARGLAGTTILPGVGAGIERQRADALGMLNERLIQQRLGLSGSVANARYGAMQNFWRNYGAVQQMPFQSLVPLYGQQIAFLSDSGIVAPPSSDFYNRGLAAGQASYGL